MSEITAGRKSFSIRAGERNAIRGRARRRDVRAHPWRRANVRVLRSRGRANHRRARPTRRPRQQHGVPAASGIDRRHLERAVRAHLPNEHLRILLHGTRGGAVHEARKRDREHRLEHRSRRQRTAGPIWTPLNVADKPASSAAKHGEDTPMQRPGQPEEVAPAYVFFASNADSSYITGEVLTLLGGETSAG